MTDGGTPAEAGRHQSLNAGRDIIVKIGVLCVLCGLSVPSSLPRAQETPADTIRIGIQKNGGYEIVTLPVETYVARVLTGEALPGTEPAALEALAIAVRTYAAANRGKHRADGFDLCDQTHCQVMRAATPDTDRAATATAGEILIYDGAPASIYYSASCGGRTERPSNVWPGADDPPYLPSQDDDGCGGSPQWSAELTAGDLQRAFAAAGYRGTLRGMRIASHNQSGRVQTLSLEELEDRPVLYHEPTIHVGFAKTKARVLQDVQRDPSVGEPDREMPAPASTVGLGRLSGQFQRDAALCQQLVDEPTDQRHGSSLRFHLRGELPCAAPRRNRCAAIHCDLR